MLMCMSVCFTHFRLCASVCVLRLGLRMRLCMKLVSTIPKLCPRGEVKGRGLSENQARAARAKILVYIYIYIYILEAYAIPPTPLEVAPDFPWIIRFSECHSQRFRCEVRQLNSLSEFFTEV